MDKNGNFAVHGDSAVKVVNFSEEAPEWKQNWQIVIFVHNKGFIPITLPFLPASYNPRGLGLLQPSCKWSKSVYEDGKYVAGPMPLTEKDFQSPVRTPQSDDVPDIEDMPQDLKTGTQVPRSSVPGTKRLPTYVALTANATVTRELLNLARDYWCKAFYPQVANGPILFNDKFPIRRGETGLDGKKCRTGRLRMVLGGRFDFSGRPQKRRQEWKVAYEADFAPLVGTTQTYRLHSIWMTDTSIVARCEQKSSTRDLFVGIAFATPEVSSKAGEVFQSTPLFEQYLHETFVTGKVRAF